MPRFGLICNHTLTLGRFFGILFVFVFAFDYASIVVYLHHRQTFVRKEIKRYLKQSIGKENVSVICAGKLEKKSIKWIRRDEFVLGGDLYDVLREERINSDSTVYHCLNDRKEKQLFARLDEYSRQNTGKGTPSGNMLYQFIKLFTVILPPQDTDNFLPAIVLRTSTVFYYSIIYYSPFSGAESPPPEYC